MVWTPFTRADHDRSTLRYASDTTEEEWRLIAPLMPPQSLRGRPRRTDLRSVVDALFYLLQSGCQYLLETDPASLAGPRKISVVAICDRFAELVREASPEHLETLSAFTAHYDQSKRIADCTLYWSVES